MGQLIPIMCDEVVPGDYFKIDNDVVIRFQPLVAPILHEVNCYIHYFFVPYRLLWEDWEDFITGGVDGNNADSPPEWDPGVGGQPEGSLWDYFGFPTGVRPLGQYPVAYPLYAYNFIYNEYYRSQDTITEYALTDTTVKLRAWEKDYFTACLPDPQRGTAPALPISGTTSAVWGAVSAANSQSLTFDSVALDPFNAHTKNSLENNTIDLSVASTFDINELRLAFAIQKFMERNARCGARYVEFLKAHFGISPNDERLQRPEYIGGMKSPVIISEVLQTSSTDATTPQANMAGHGLSADSSNCVKYHVKEYGLIMGIMSIMPRTAYQQGINKQWLRKTRYDHYYPEYAHLGEQQVLRVELYASGVEAENETVFGYIPRYDEMRTKHDIVCGEMRSTYDYWHLGRQFGAAPTLDQTFIECNPRKEIFADDAEPGIIANICNRIYAVRPIPMSGEPGLIDHF